MANPFLAEVRIFSGSFAPKGWARCDGQLLPISQNTALFSLLGTTYGGDGKSNFALPDLRGAAPLGAGQGAGLSAYFLGQSGGSQFVTLLNSEMPSHAHGALAASGTGYLNTPTGNAWASNSRGFPPAYAPSGSLVPMVVTGTSMAGGNLPHNNMPPYLGLTFIIALSGVYPPRS